MQSINSVPLKAGMRVFVRGDLDVPIVDGEIQEQYRLKSLLPTLKYIIKQKAKPIIAGHIGKPDGHPSSELTTRNLIPFFVENLETSDFELMENLRFDPREEADDDTFARELASKADIYVNESFATSHREHTSIVGVPKYLPHYAGIHLTEEIDTLSKVLTDPKRPFVSIVGGAKLESKMPVISKLLKLSDMVLLGGKLALAWKEPIPNNLVIPTDYAEEEKDIGTKSIESFEKVLETARTVLWAGPLGAYEDPKYILGTKEIGETIVRIMLMNEATSIIGGGDTIAAVEKCGLLDKFTFVSVGGGAMLQFLVEGTLPGIKALD